MGKDSGKMNMGTIVEAKTEYTKQMINILQPIIYEALLVLYTSAVQTDEDNVLGGFAEELKNVPKWNNDVIKSEDDRIQSQCAYFEDLLTAVVLSNVRILTSIRMGAKKKVKISMPSTMNFVHQVYVNISKDILINLRMFDVTAYDGVITNNISIVYDLIAKCIENTIRDILPLKEILMSSLHSHNQDSDDESQSGDDDAPINETRELSEPPIEDNMEENIGDNIPQSHEDNEHNAKSFVNEVLHDSDDEDVKTVPLDGDNTSVTLNDEKMETKEEIPEPKEIDKQTPSFLD